MEETASNMIGNALFSNNDSSMLDAVTSLLKIHQGNKEKDISLGTPMLVLTSVPGKDSVHANVVLGSNHPRRNEGSDERSQSHSENEQFPSFEQVHALARASLVASTQLDIAQQLAQQAGIEQQSVQSKVKKQWKTSRQRTNSRTNGSERGDSKSKQRDTAPNKVPEMKQPKALVCSFEGCNRKFAWQNHLNYHELTHTNNRQHKCPEESCGKMFYTAQRLNVHMRTHTGERPFLCSHSGCGKMFTTAGNLKNHERIHTGEQPFVCDFPNCSRRFTEHSSLRKHKQTHSGEKPFECPICGKKFTQSGSRHHHMTRHQLDEEIRASYVKGGQKESRKEKLSGSDLGSSQQEKGLAEDGSHLTCSPQVLVLNNAYPGLQTSESIVFSHGLSDQIVTVTTQGMDQSMVEAGSISLSNTLLNSDGLPEDTLQVKSNELVVLSEAPIYQHEDPSGDIVYATDILDHEEVTCANYGPTEVSDYAADMSHTTYTSHTGNSVAGAEDFDDEGIMTESHHYVDQTVEIELPGYVIPENVQSEFSSCDDRVEKSEEMDSELHDYVVSENVQSNFSGNREAKSGTAEELSGYMVSDNVQSEFSISGSTEVSAKMDNGLSDFVILEENVQSNFQSCDTREVKTEIDSELSNIIVLENVKSEYSSKLGAKSVQIDSSLLPGYMVRENGNSESTCDDRGAKSETGCQTNHVRSEVELTSVKQETSARFSSKAVNTESAQLHSMDPMMECDEDPHKQ